MKPGRDPCTPFSRPPGHQVSVSGRTLAPGPPHRKELKSSPGGSALGPAGLYHRVACLPARPQPRSVWTVFMHGHSGHSSRGVLAFNLVTPSLHTRTRGRNALTTPLPEARKLQSPQGWPGWSGGRGLGPVVCTLRPGGQRLDGGPGWPGCHRCPLPSAPRGRDTTSITVCLHRSTSNGPGAEAQKVLRIWNSFGDRGFLSTLPYCVPLMLPCAGAD